MSEPIKKPIQINPESYKPETPKMMEDYQKKITEFVNIYDSNAFPERFIHETIPKPGYYYTLPQFLSHIISYIEKDITSSEANVDLTNIIGAAYTSLWLSNDVCSPALEDMWRINGIPEAIWRAMRYYGRDFLYIEGNESPEYFEEIKKAIVVSINQGIPVLAGNVCGIHDFSTITGYDKNGELLTGWAANMHHAKERLENGMFIKEYSLMKKNTRFLFIKGKNGSSLSDKEIINNAVDTMKLTETQNNEYCIYQAGFAALSAFKNELDKPNETIFETEKEFGLGVMLMNVHYARGSIKSFITRLGEKHNSNPERTELISYIQTISDNLVQIGGEMEEVKNEGNLSAAAKCEQMSKLVQKCIDEDTVLLNKLIELSNVLP